MKRCFILLLPAMLLLSACGAASRYALEAQQFQDRIYQRPTPVIELLTADDFRALAASKIATDSLNNGIMLSDLVGEYYSHPFNYRYRYFFNPYLYGSWSYDPTHFWGPYNTFGQYFYDRYYSWYWESYNDPYWYLAESWPYGYFTNVGSFNHYKAYNTSPSKDESEKPYSNGFAGGERNHRRAGSMYGSPDGVYAPADAPRRSGIPVKAYEPSNDGYQSGIRSGGARRSGGYTVSSSDYSSSAESVDTRGGSYSSDNPGGGSGGGGSTESSSSGSSSGGGYSGGSGGGGGGRR